MWSIARLTSLDDAVERNGVLACAHIEERAAFAKDKLDDRRGLRLK